ncbi:hypothetical protein VTL71DRAFT_16146 [Oculimacula yallundae]|uniref:N-acetyltransferase domain-containing protein n=1 Tax=Oculimacula yallundae TaxID=86028 RepID=A0ABR4CFY6_9HELO
MASNGPDPRFFTHTWSITLPTHPHLRFVRLTPSNHAAWLDVESHPDNNIPPGYPGQDILWSATRREESTKRFLKNWGGFQEKRNGIYVVVVDVGIGVDGRDGDESGNGTGRVIGQGQVEEVKPQECNIGMELVTAARGKGVGRALFEVLIRLSNEIEGEREGIRVSAGTMKSNGPMRKLARKMGLVEREEVVEVPGRGVVAEVCWDIERESWRGLEWRVEFGELDL